MADKIPVVYDETSAGVRQLQTTEELDLDVNQRVARLEQQMIDLARYLVAQGIEVPPALLRA